MTRRGYVYESLLRVITYSCARQLQTQFDRSLRLTVHIHRRHFAHWITLLITQIGNSDRDYSFCDMAQLFVKVDRFTYYRPMNVSRTPRGKPRAGRRLPSCRFICVSKKSRKYFSLSLSIHTPHLDAGWINLVSFSSERFFNWTRTIRVAMGKKKNCRVQVRSNEFPIYCSAILIFNTAADNAVLQRNTLAFLMERYVA